MLSFPIVQQISHNIEHSVIYFHDSTKYLGGVGYDTLYLEAYFIHDSNAICYRNDIVLLNEDVTW